MYLRSTMHTARANYELIITFTINHLVYEMPMVMSCPKSKDIQSTVIKRRKASNLHT